MNVYMCTLLYKSTIEMLTIMYAETCWFSELQQEKLRPHFRSHSPVDCRRRQTHKHTPTWWQINLWDNCFAVDENTITQYNPLACDTLIAISDQISCTEYSVSDFCSFQINFNIDWWAWREQVSEMRLKWWLNCCPYSKSSIVVLKRSEWARVFVAEDLMKFHWRLQEQKERPIRTILRWTEHKSWITHKN